MPVYQYIDHLFPSDEYNKLVCHFSINDVAFAERSVDTRMLSEMSDGRQALTAALADQPAAIVQANAGGPYGSSVLRGVQADSDGVWAKIRNGEAGDTAATWFKATIAIDAHEAKDWSARAVVDGTPAQAFPFERRA